MGEHKEREVTRRVRSKSVAGEKRARMSMRLRPLLTLLLAALLYAAKKGRPTHHENAFAAADKLDLRIFLSSSPRFTAFNDSSSLIWKQEGMVYADFSDREHHVQVPITDGMLRNGSLFAHVYVTKAGFSPDPKALETFDRWATTHNIHELVTYGERLKPVGLHNLITGEPAPWEAELRRGAAESKAAGRPEGEYISYWQPKLHAQLLIDTEAYPLGQMPPLMFDYLQAYRLVAGHRYRPLVYINELTSMRIHWQAINASRTSLPLELSFGPLPAKRFQWMVNLQHSFKMNEETLGISEKESEDLRGMFGARACRSHTFLAPTDRTLSHTRPRPHLVSSHQPSVAVHDGRRQRRPPALRCARIQVGSLVLELCRLDGGTLVALSPP